MENNRISFSFVEQADILLIPRINAGDVGIDFKIAKGIIIPAKQCVNIPLGICNIVVPDGYYLMLVGRSSALPKTGLLVATSIIDPSYTGEIHAQVYNPTEESIILHKYGSLIQGVLHRYMPISNLTLTPKGQKQTTRGDKGFGSTGNSPI